ncbi:MAG: hypothetical protein K9K67_10460 [Bacteriovoracaceae bacterium]|nr:hypothetical protein [Bacteriovoracaceae bacterium]
MKHFIKSMFSILVFLSTGLDSFASVRADVLKTDMGTILVSRPRGWTIEERVLGLPFVLFGPKENGQRSNVSLTHTGQELKLDSPALKKDILNYKLGKSKWANKVGAKIIKILPLKTYQSERGHKVTQVGVTYQFKKKNYIEKSYYIECGINLLHSKALTLEKNKSHYHEIEKMIKGIDCAQ